MADVIAKEVESRVISNSDHLPCRSMLRISHGTLSLRLTEHWRNPNSLYSLLTAAALRPLSGHPDLLSRVFFPPLLSRCLLEMSLGTIVRLRRGDVNVVELLLALEPVAWLLMSLPVVIVIIRQPPGTTLRWGLLPLGVLGPILSFWNANKLSVIAPGLEWI